MSHEGPGPGWTPRSGPGRTWPCSRSADLEVLPLKTESQVNPRKIHVLSKFLVRKSPRPSRPSADNCLVFFRKQRFLVDEIPMFDAGLKEHWLFGEAKSFFGPGQCCFWFRWYLWDLHVEWGTYCGWLKQNSTDKPPLNIYQLVIRISISHLH